MKQRIFQSIVTLTGAHYIWVIALITDGLIDSRAAKNLQFDKKHTARYIFLAR